eukprot:5924502-Amphidinium_carterae.1
MLQESAEKSGLGLVPCAPCEEIHGTILRKVWTSEGSQATQHPECSPTCPKCSCLWARGNFHPSVMSCIESCVPRCQQRRSKSWRARHNESPLPQQLKVPSCLKQFAAHPLACVLSSTTLKAQGSNTH